MAHFAKVINGDVIQVIVAEQEVIDNGELGEPSNWIKTSYNTHGNQHYDPKTGEVDDRPLLRKNFAGVGYTYDKERDAFIPPQPHNSWTLNEDTCQWDCPVAYPDDENMYQWNEEAQSWDVVTDE